ncbi:RNA-binding (RRM/RBD/RNP motif) family protein [Forsythia ovata]|uniref:RNA-binding protein 48 n=2 Tax=Forsythia ovata TaxID=205694 RepID=A0ABD1XCR3_9LAMI
MDYHPDRIRQLQVEELVKIEIVPAVVAEYGRLAQLERVVQRFAELTIAHKGEVKVIVTSLIPTGVDNTFSKEIRSRGQENQGMPKYKDEHPAIRVYTVCDESKYLIVRNVPSLGCGDELLKLFSTYGQVEECKPMDAEDCEPYTDVYWIKYYQVDNARFAKKKLDEFVFLGNRIQVSYAPQNETLSDTKEKLEGRRKEVVARLNPRRSQGSSVSRARAVSEPSSVSNASRIDSAAQTSEFIQREFGELQNSARDGDSSSMTSVSSDKEYFSSQSMNQTVQLVREKLNKIQSSVEHGQADSAKRTRVDNRRRI